MKFDRFFLWGVLVTMAIVPSVAAAQVEIVTNGLISFWSFDEPTISGNTVKDLWGNNHGNIEGAVITEGKINDALLFDGSDDLVEVPHSESLDLKKAITIECWFLLKGNSSNNDCPRLVSKGGSTPSNGAYAIHVGDGRSANRKGWKGFLCTNHNFQVDGPNHADGAWHHIVATYDTKGRGKLFLDSVCCLDLPATGDLVQTEDPLHIGDGNNERHFNGIIDEVRIYNRALDEDEVQQNFEAKSNTFAVGGASSKLTTTWAGIKAGD